jgi:hypothetical protein
MLGNIRNVVCVWTNKYDLPEFVHFMYFKQGMYNSTSYKVHLFFKAGYIIPYAVKLDEKSYVSMFEFPTGI